MSLRHIVLGVTAGITALVFSLVVGQHFSVHPLAVLFACLFVASIAFSISIEKKSRIALKRYWDRTCTGFLWKRRFPKASSESIRQFLNIFVTAFMFPNRELKFSPDDRILDVYGALYPDRSTPDALEVETLAQLIAKQYGIEIATIWRNDITLGELYANVTAP